MNSRNIILFLFSLLALSGLLAQTNSPFVSVNILDKKINPNQTTQAVITVIDPEPGATLNITGIHTLGKVIFEDVMLTIPQDYDRLKGPYVVTRSITALPKAELPAGRWKYVVQAEYVEQETEPQIAIIGHKFHDKNGNGKWDKSPVDSVQEEGIGNVKIILEGPDGKRHRFTSASGKFQFYLKQTGAYTIREEIPEGWEKTRPESISFFVASMNQDSFPEFLFGNWQGEQGFIEDEGDGDNKCIHLTFFKDDFQKIIEEYQRWQGRGGISREALGLNHWTNQGQFGILGKHVTRPVGPGAGRVMPRRDFMTFANNWMRNKVVGDLDPFDLDDEKKLCIRILPNCILQVAEECEHDLKFHIDEQLFGTGKSEWNREQFQKFQNNLNNIIGQDAPHPNVPIRFPAAGYGLWWPDVIAGSADATAFEYSLLETLENPLKQIYTTDPYRVPTARGACLTQFTLQTDENCSTYLIGINGSKIRASSWTKREFQHVLGAQVVDFLHDIAMDLLLTRGAMTLRKVATILAEKLKDVAIEELMSELEKNLGELNEDLEGKTEEEINEFLDEKLKEYGYEKDLIDRLFTPDGDSDQGGQEELQELREKAQDVLDLIIELLIEKSFTTGLLALPPDGEYPDFDIPEFPELPLPFISSPSEFVSLFVGTETSAAIKGWLEVSVENQRQRAETGSYVLYRREKLAEDVMTTTGGVTRTAVALSSETVENRPTISLLTRGEVMSGAGVVPIIPGAPGHGNATAFLESFSFKYVVGICYCEEHDTFTWTSHIKGSYTMDYIAGEFWLGIMQKLLDGFVESVLEFKDGEVDLTNLEAGLVSRVPLIMNLNLTHRP